MASGKLLNKWHAHYRSITCLTLSDDESLLISGSEDGCVRVWSLMMYWIFIYHHLFILGYVNSCSLIFTVQVLLFIFLFWCYRMFDDIGKEAASSLYKYSFSEHTLRVTDVVCGHGLCNSIIISSSMDRTCKVRSVLNEVLN